MQPLPELIRQLGQNGLVQSSASGAVNYAPANLDAAAALLGAALKEGHSVAAAEKMKPALQHGTPLLVLDRSRLSQSGMQDAASGLIWAEAGARLPELEKTIQTKHLSLGFAPFTPVLTIGEYLEKGEPGPSSPLFGSLIERTFQWDGVLPGGQRVQTRLTPASAAGPDVWRVCVGAEGSLGLTLKAVFGAVPACSRYTRLTFRLAEDSLSFAWQLIAQQLLPASMFCLISADHAALWLGFLEPTPFAAEQRQEIFRQAAEQQGEIDSSATPEAGDWHDWAGVILNYKELIQRSEPLHEWSKQLERPLLVAGFGRRAAVLYAPASQLRWAPLPEAESWLWRGLKNQLDPDDRMQPGIEPRRRELVWPR